MNDRASILHTCHAFSNLKGVDMADRFGSNVDGFVFACADLTDSDWSGITSAHGVDLRCATLTGANLSGLDTAGWDMTGANLCHAILDGVTVRALMHGAVLCGASMRNITWTRGGAAAARGIVLPEHVPFETWTGGDDFHAGIAQVLRQEYPGDPNILDVANYVMAQPQRDHYMSPFPCWTGSVRYCQNRVPKAIDRIWAAFEKYPAMKLMARWKMAEREISRQSKAPRA